MRIVDAHAYDHVARAELGASRAVGGDGADETVAGGQRGFFLEGISPEAHVDVGAGEAGVQHADLGLLGWGRGQGCGDYGDVGRVAEGSDDGLSDGGHFEGRTIDLSWDEVVMLSRLIYDGAFYLQRRTW